LTGLRIAYTAYSTVDMMCVLCGVGYFYPYVQENVRFLADLPHWATNNTNKTPAARGLEEFFPAVLERFLQPIHALRV
jgi:hypothetical protein